MSSQVEHQTPTLGARHADEHFTRGVLGRGEYGFAVVRFTRQYAHLAGAAEALPARVRPIRATLQYRVERGAVCGDFEYLTGGGDFDLEGLPVDDRRRREPLGMQFDTPPRRVVRARRRS